MKSKKYIAIVGLPGSGKTDVCSFFRNHGYTVLRFGDQTDIELKEQKLPLTEENERRIREELRQKFGMAAYAIKIEPRMREAARVSDRIVLDGMRSWEEYVFLKEKFPELKTVCVYASAEVRYARLGKRPVRPLATNESRARDIAEITKLNSGGPIAIADHLIVNEGTRKDLEKELYRFLQTLQ